jgi:hypothetical protein
MRTFTAGAAALLLAPCALPAVAADYSFATDIVPGGQADAALVASYFSLKRSLTVPGFQLEQEYTVVEEAAQLRVGLGGQWHVGAAFAYDSTNKLCYSYQGNCYFTYTGNEGYQNLDVWVKRRLVDDGGFSVSALVGVEPNTSGKYAGAYYGELDLGWSVTPSSRVFVEYEPYISDASSYRNSHGIAAGAWFVGEPWTLAPTLHYRYYEKTGSVSSESAVIASVGLRAHVAADTYLTPGVSYGWYGPVDSGVAHFNVSDYAWSVGLSLYHVFGAP